MRDGRCRMADGGCRVRDRGCGSGFRLGMERPPRPGSTADSAGSGQRSSSGAGWAQRRARCAGMPWDALEWPGMLGAQCLYPWIPCLPGSGTRWPHCEASLAARAAIPNPAAAGGFEPRDPNVPGAAPAALLPSPAQSSPAQPSPALSCPGASSCLL